MREIYSTGSGMLLVSALVLTVNVHAENVVAPATDGQMIASAMTAAPDKAAQNATIVAMEADGSMRTLRAGSNGFTCMADNPATPGPDPLCMDENAMAWVHARVAHVAPPQGRSGFMYMLAGGTDASNTDPYATKPEGSTTGSIPVRM